VISIRKSATELDRLENLFQTVTAGWGNAVQYTLEVDPLDVQLFRQHIETLGDQVGTARPV
jgi:hypothetical protein